MKPEKQIKMILIHFKGVILCIKNQLGVANAINFCSTLAMI